MKEEKKINEQELEKVSGGGDMGSVEVLFRCPQCGEELQGKLIGPFPKCPACWTAMNVVSGSQKLVQD